MTHQVYKRFFHALRSSRRAFASQFDDKSIYPIVYLPDVVKKIAHRTNTHIQALYDLNRYFQNSEFDRAL